jgi:hypothetical protein
VVVPLDRCRFQAQHVTGDWPIEIIAVANASENRDRAVAAG